MRTHLFFLLILCFTLSLSAQDESTEELVPQRSKMEDINYLLFDVMQSEKIIDETIGSIVAQFEDVGAELSPDDFEEFRDAVLEIASSKTKKLMRLDMPGLYDKYFTHDEIKELIVFFATAAGSKYIRVSPKIQEEIMNLMMTRYLPELRNEINLKLKELKS